MSRTYKMPLLLAFYNNGDLKLRLGKDDIYESFEKFYSKGSNAVDLLRDNNSGNFSTWGKKDYLDKAKKPQNAFINSAKDYFYKDGENYCLIDKLDNYKDNEVFLKHFKDVIDFRTRKFYKERLEGKYENL